jgi:hypothetical protein
MNSRTLLLLLASTTTTNARLQGQRELSTSLLGDFQICHTVDETHFETITRNIFGAFYHAIFHQEDYFESCLPACESLCKGFSSFEATTDKCVCTKEQEFTEDAETETTDTVVCPLGFAPSSTTGECVETCQSPYNPCGPGSECIDDAALGHTCKNQYDSSVCPVGCGQHSSCLNGSCICDEGFERRESYLPCQEKS